MSQNPYGYGKPRCKGDYTVLGQLNQYIIKSALRTITGLVLFALAVLLLERLLRIFEVVSSSTKPASDATQMVINLLPHYLGIAIPMALMLGTIITIDRMSRSSELTSAFGSGVSLFHMTKPFILISIVLMGFNFALEGYMQPIGRYGYREVVHSVGQKSFAAILREGKFTKFGDITFYLEPGGGTIFIYEEMKNEGLRVTTALSGELIIRDETEQPVLLLENGDSFQITADKTIKGQLSFKVSSIPHSVSGTKFRARGNDERELTSTQLFNNRDGKAFTSISVETNNAALHLRMARVYLLFLLPFIAVPFGINYGRNPSSAGIVVGIVSLVTLQKALEFGQKLGARGEIPPWAGIWPLMGIVTVSAFFIFRNSALKMGQPPLATLSIFMADVMKDIRKGARAIIPFAKDGAVKGGGVNS